MRRIDYIQVRSVDLKLEIPSGRLDLRLLNTAQVIGYDQDDQEGNQAEQCNRYSTAETEGEWVGQPGTAHGRQTTNPAQEECQQLRQQVGVAHYQQHCAQNRHKQTEQ